MKKVCVITGGTGGIGFASAKELGKQYFVYICDVSQEKVREAVEELRAQGLDADGMVCDISDKEQTDKLARRAASLGEIAGVVQLAGLTPTFAPAPDILKVDTIGPMNINESFYEVMNGGCIIDICSSTAHFIPVEKYPLDKFELSLTDKDAFYQAMLEHNETYPENMRANMAYTWARCFVYWYARQCAYRFGREKGIRVMTVSPGVIRTQMSMDDFKRSASGMEGLDRTMSWCALGRPGRPEEIAFLFSTIIDERNSYLTGTDIYLDGGCDAAGYHGQREWYPGTKH